MGTVSIIRVPMPPVAGEALSKLRKIERALEALDRHHTQLAATLDGKFLDVDFHTLKLRQFRRASIDLVRELDEFAGQFMRVAPLPWWKRIRNWWIDRTEQVKREEQL